MTPSTAACRSVNIKSMRDQDESTGRFTPYATPPNTMTAAGTASAAARVPNKSVLACCCSVKGLTMAGLAAAPVPTLLG